MLDLSAKCTGGLCGDPGDIGSCGQERYLERVDVIRQGSKLSLHAAGLNHEPEPSVYSFQQPATDYPADLGRHVSCGLRQSMPSSM